MGWYGVGGVLGYPRNGDMVSGVGCQLPRCEAKRWLIVRVVGSLTRGEHDVLMCGCRRLFVGVDDVHSSLPRVSRGRNE